MKFSFEAIIYKVGINPCVDVPPAITGRMKVAKGYIPVNGKINNHPFQQTLVPVKDSTYRLYVNGPMLKGSGTKVGDIAKFNIQQDTASRDVPMPPLFKKKLAEHKLMPAFKKLTPYRQKEILKYLNFLKTEESLLRNIDKVINTLRNAKDS